MSAATRKVLKMNESYLGAKNGSGVYQAIINLIPPHNTFAETFLGTGAIMRRKAPAQYNIGIDKSKIMLDKFNYAADELLCTDAIEWLENYQPKGKTVIYSDPPYMPCTRTSKAKYEHELTVDDHVRLINAKKALSNENTYLLISGYKNDLYEDMLKGWWSKDFQAMTRGGVRTETVWCNFEPGEVHYHTYAGKDYTDRQRIKRKAQGWAKKYQALPPGEQQAILNALLTV
jgi:DNA adenine methylase